MAANTFGTHFRVTTFGESHGPALGVVIDGCPAGVKFDSDLLHKLIARRRPGQKLTSDRNEADLPEILSGVYQGVTLGTPIAAIVRNQDAQSEDYQTIQTNPRAGHADDLWQDKFGFVDHRGGGRASGRETVSRVIAGAFAQMLLIQTHPQIQFTSFASQIGPHKLSFDELNEIKQKSLDNTYIDSFAARFPSLSRTQIITDLLLEAKRNGQSYGGKAIVIVSHMPKGLGQPVFHKLKSDMAAASLSLGATFDFRMGAHIDPTQTEGSEFHVRETDETDPYFGDRGGISTGRDLVIEVGFKPTSSVMDIAKKGRHDPCIVPRALVALEAMVSLVLADHTLWMRSDRLLSKLEP